MVRFDDDLAAIASRAHAPPPFAIGRELRQFVAHEEMAMSACQNLVARSFPHHAGAKARVAEGFQQRLGRHTVIGLLVETKAALETIDNSAPERQALDALGCPVRAHLVTRHAPHLLGVGLEEDRIEALAELVGGPVLEAFHLLDREELVAKVGDHAGGRAQDAKVGQSLEGPEGIAVELALVIDAAHPGALDEIVLAEDLVPHVDDLRALRKEAVPADVEAIAFVLHGPADPADVNRILFDNRDRLTLLSQQVGCRQARRPRTDDRYVDFERRVDTIH